MVDVLPAEGPPSAARNNSPRISAFQRFVALSILFAAELLLVTVWLDTASLTRAYLLTRILGDWGPWTLSGTVAFAFLLVLFGYLQNRSALSQLAREPVREPFGRQFLGYHVGAMVLLGVTSRILFARGLTGSWTWALTLGFVASGLGAILLASLAFLPAAIWLKLLTMLKYAWLYAGAAAVAVCLVGNALRLLWGPAMQVTFAVVKVLLRPFLSSIVCDPSKGIIGSPSFQVRIAAQCSGLEGIGLMLIFILGWLWLCRHELRFPQAMVLIPVGVVTAFLLNSVRIAALILIGNAGAAGIAEGGFHSQAGWISFNLIALGVVAGSQRSRWISRNHSRPESASLGFENPVVPFLVPFIAILAAGMVSRAFTSEFEWLYPLRLFAAAAVLWRYRERYARMDWKFGWFGISAGVAVFLLWIGMERFTAAGATSATVPGMSASHGFAWIAWLTLRILGGVITVPIAEELAFRGYLLRRFVAADFEKVSYCRTTLQAVLVSSVMFGLMHGSRWMAGCLAGLVYALVLRRTGRLGEAVAAHATTNAVLAAWVLIKGDWGLW